MENEKAEDMEVKLEELDDEEVDNKEVKEVDDADVDVEVCDDDEVGRMWRWMTRTRRA